jgi:hypothetical protein
VSVWKVPCTSKVHKKVSYASDYMGAI